MDFYPRYFTQQLLSVLIYQNGTFACITIGKLIANFVLGVAVAMCLSSFAFYVYTMLQRWPIKVIHSTPSKSDTKNGYHQQKTWATTTILCSNTTIGTLLLTSTYYTAAINDIHTRSPRSQSLFIPFHDVVVVRRSCYIILTGGSTSTFMTRPVLGLTLSGAITSRFAPRTPLFGGWIVALSTNVAVRR